MKHLISVYLLLLSCQCLSSEDHPLSTATEPHDLQQSQTMTLEPIDLNALEQLPRTVESHPTTSSRAELHNQNKNTKSLQQTIPPHADEPIKPPALVLKPVPSSTQKPAQLAIIIDDIGYNWSLGKRALELSDQLTFALLPFATYSDKLYQHGVSGNRELMLHAPMSALSGKYLAEDGLESGLSQAEFYRRLRKALDSMPEVRGVNNHMGSQLTQELQPMHWLTAELKQRELYFIDSKTSAQSVAFEVASRAQVPSLKRDVFLDNNKSPEAILNQLQKAIARAHHKGQAIAICHPYPETLAVLSSTLPQLQSLGIELTPVSKLKLSGGDN